MVNYLHTGLQLMGKVIETAVDAVICFLLPCLAGSLGDLNENKQEPEASHGLKLVIPVLRQSGWFNSINFVPCYQRYFKAN